MSKKNIILASTSKRRSEILASCGIEHMVIPSDIKEIFPKKKHLVSSVIKNAQRKVRGVLKGAEDLKKDAVIIGADTLVALDSEVIGKPKGASDAKKLLRKFSTKEIDVYTGLCVLDTKTHLTTAGFEKSSLYVKKIHEKDIDKYFIKLGSFDKAGGFSIEGVGSFIFDDIKGSYFNILGLPMVKLNELFAEIGLDLLDFC